MPLTLMLLWLEAEILSPMPDNDLALRHGCEELPAATRIRQVPHPI
jgi:hypothetical protein